MVKEFQNHLPSAVTKDVAMSAMEFSAEEIRERMSGNLCRCGTYNGIVEAVRETFVSLVTFVRTGLWLLSALVATGVKISHDPVPNSQFPPR